MAARPNDLPSWATGPTAEISVPPTATRANGWVAGVKPPNSWFNWWMNLVYQWVSYLQSGGVFDDMEEAVSEMEIGDIATVYENDNDTGPGSEVVIKATGINTINNASGDVDACGSLVVLGMTTTVIGVNRDLDGAESGGTPFVTYTLTNVDIITRVRTDGEITVIATGQYVEAFNALTGASLWIWDSGAAGLVKDICMCANRVYVVHHETSGAGDAVADRACHALNKTTGVVVWSYRHGSLSINNRLYTVATNGRQVFVGGISSDYASGSNMRALRATDGADFDGESGAIVDDDGLAWNAVHTVDPSNGCMDHDGQFLYVGFDETSSHQLKVISQADGTTAFGYADPDPTMNAQGVACDQDFVYLAVSDLDATNPEGYVKAFPKGSDALIWQWGNKDGTADHAACAAIASDGQALFALAGGTVQKAFRVTRGNVPMRVRKVDPDIEFVRYRNWVLQPEAQ